MALDGFYQGVDAAAKAGGAVLQRLPLDRPASLRPLYWRNRGGIVTPGAGGALRIASGATLATDTYFGALFERPWRLYTRTANLILSVTLQGRATLRVFRRPPGGTPVLLHEAAVAGPARVPLPNDAPHHRQAGLVWFELTAHGGPAVLERADWITAADPGPARLAVVICTFNRQEPLGAVLSALAADAGLDGAVARIIVVNQGAPALRTHPAVADAAACLGNRLHVVEQANLGGAGGFGRGLLEVLDDDDATHVCFLDDDVRIEPESLRRMAVFFSLATAPVALGGHMLDGLRPTALYEAGATIRPNWSLQPIRHGMDLCAPRHLLRLGDTVPMHYNGWWMFGFDKRLVETVGMPLPCFIRGDDVEFGLRLHNRGIATVALPGVAIWHEPFYLKVGGWQLYYETRNALIAAALHEPFPRRQAAIQVAKRLLIHLLTYRYYNAALIIQATRDFRQGPAILDQDPRPLHAALAAVRARWPDGAAIPGERVLPPASVGRSPRSPPGFVLALGRAVARNWLCPTRADAPPHRLLAKNLVWFRIRHDSLAVDTHWDRDLPTYRRDRAAFRILFREGMREAWCLWQQAAGLRQAWRDGAPHLTSLPFWREYVRRGHTTP